MFLQVIAIDSNGKVKKMNALKWYANCDYIRGGRSLEGQQVDVDGEKGTLTSLGRWLVSLTTLQQRQEDSDEESIEEDEDKPNTLEVICTKILAFFEAEGVNKKDWFFDKIGAAQKAGGKQINNILWRALENELGNRDVYRALFRKTVSVRR